MSDSPVPDRKAPAPWRVIRSQRLVADRWLNLRADACVTAEGVEIAPYYVLDYPDWVQVVALDAEQRLVLVEQYRHGLGALSLELPAGGVEGQDADAIAAGRRELAEETGYTAQDWRYVGRLAPNTASHANHCHVVLARGARPTGAPVDDPRERLRVVTKPLDEALDWAFSGGMSQAMHVASLAIALRALGRWPG